MKSVIFLIALFICSIYSQSSFLEKGKSGFLFGGSFVKNSNENIFSGNIGFSISGVFDFGFSVNQSSDNIGGTNDVISSSFSPQIKYFLHKEDITVPVSFAAYAALE